MVNDVALLFLRRSILFGLVFLLLGILEFTIFLLLVDTLLIGRCFGEIIAMVLGGTTFGGTLGEFERGAIAILPVPGSVHFPQMSFGSAQFNCLLPR